MRTQRRPLLKGSLPMTVAVVLFWLATGLLVYHLIGYGLLLFVINKLNGKRALNNAMEIAE